MDYQRRALIAKNHTATHILNFALRQVDGEGSVVVGGLTMTVRCWEISVTSVAL